MFAMPAAESFSGWHPAFISLSDTQFGHLAITLMLRSPSNGSWKITEGRSLAPTSDSEILAAVRQTHPSWVGERSLEYGERWICISALE